MSVHGGLVILVDDGPKRTVLAKTSSVVTVMVSCSLRSGLDQDASTTACGGSGSRGARLTCCASALSRAVPTDPC
jgi:hypothetical protein